MSIVTPTPIDTSVIYGYVYDGITPVVGAIVRFNAPTFILNDNSITIEEQIETDVDGRFQVTLPQTIAAGVLVTVTTEFDNSLGNDEVTTQAIIVGTTSPASVQESLAVAANNVVVTVGPAGPTGPAGAAGATGPQGPIGPAGLQTKAGIVPGASLSLVGGVLVYDVVFTTPYASTNYIIQMSATEGRVFQFENVATTGFRINTNSAVAIPGSVHWSTREEGEA